MIVRVKINMSKKVKQKERKIEADLQNMERRKRLYISQSQTFQNANTEVSSCYI